MKNVLYLFCIAREDSVPHLEGKGVSGSEPLVQEKYGALTAVLCEVPLTEFAGPTAESKLQDLDWIGPRAVRHAEVIAEVMEHSPVLPARFGTLFSSLDLLERLLEVNRTKIEDFLDSMEGMEEWAVKGLLARTKATEAIASEALNEQRDALASKPPGLRYFKEKQIRAEAGKALRAWLEQVTTRVADELIASSASRRKKDVLPNLTEEDDLETILNWAFLVNRSRLSDFNDRIDRINKDLDAHGLHFHVSGPWPPYSFCPALGMEPGS